MSRCDNHDVNGRDIVSARGAVRLLYVTNSRCVPHMIGMYAVWGGDGLCVLDALSCAGEPRTAGGMCMRARSRRTRPEFGAKGLFSRRPCDVECLFWPGKRIVLSNP